MATTTTPSPRADEIKTALQLSAVIGAFCVLFNVAFYFLSAMYFDDKRASQGMMSTITPATVLHTRLTFVAFSGTVCAGIVATLFAPKWISHGLASVASLASLIAGFYAFRAGMPGALGMALMVIGLVMPVLVWFSLQRSRAAWAFLVALCYVLAIVLLFGAPKVRAQIDIGLWTAMIIPGLFAVAAVGLSLIRADYRDRS